MLESELKPLHYILPLDRVASVLKKDIVCHTLADVLFPDEIRLNDALVEASMEGGRRTADRRVHEYVNLYLCARNPVFYRILKDFGENTLAVLDIDVAVLRRDGVMITGFNTATNLAGVPFVEAGLKHVDSRLLYGDSWQHENPETKRRNMAIKCAEALIPLRVPARYVLRARVATYTAVKTLHQQCSGLQVQTDRWLFFKR